MVLNEKNEDFQTNRNLGYEKSVSKSNNSIQMKIFFGLNSLINTVCNA